jgi:hypothetical protein
VLKQQVLYYFLQIGLPIKRFLKSPLGINEKKASENPLQGLLEQNVLTQEEFAEQKRLVLDSLRKLTH